MPSPRRQSPRAAIRKWLANTGQGRSSISKRHTDPQSEVHKEHSKNPQSPYDPHTKPEQQYGQSEDPLPEPEDQPSSHQARRKARGSLNREDFLARIPLRPEPEKSPKQTRDSRNLADHLGLHAPFRSFATRATDLKTEVQRDHDRRKRKQSPSTSSSYLELAACFRKRFGGSQAPKAEATIDPSRNQRDRTAGPSPSPSATVESPEKVTKSYERRSRHRTRKDRYDLKTDKKRGETKDGEKVTRSKPRKKRKGVEKSGAALMHGFSAGNVESERLTLKPTAPFGVFGKGRASSPVRRKGLPDLTFSEMNFLNHRKADPAEHPLSRSKQSRRKKDKAADAEAEISRFFVSSKGHGRTAEGIRRPRESPERQSEVARNPLEQQTSSLPPVELPSKPFLGFGSCGPGHVSPVALVSDIGSRFSPRQKPPSNRSTTYYTWSETQASRHAQVHKPGLSRSPSNQGHVRPHQEPNQPVRRRKRSMSTSIERNFQGRISPIRQCDNQESRSRVDGDLSVLSDAHKHRIKATALEPDMIIKPTNVTKQTLDGVGTDREADPALCLDDTPSAKLASLLATQGRSDLLGTVLDALLNRYNHCRSQGSRSSQNAGNKEQVHLCAPEATSEARMLHESENLRTHKLPSAGNVQATLAGSHQAPDFRRLQSLSGQVTSASPSRTSWMQTHSEPTQGQAEILGRQSLQPDVIGSVTLAPDANSAWTGYHNFYQAQEYMEKRDWQDHESDSRDVVHGDQGSFDKSRQPHGQGTAYNDNQHLDLDEEPLLELSPDFQYVTTHTSSLVDQAGPQAWLGTNKISEQPPGEGLYTDQYLQEAPLDSTYQPFGQGEDDPMEQGYNSDLDFFSLTGRPPNSISARGFATTAPIEDYQPSGRGHVELHDRFGLLTPCSAGDGKTPHEAPLSRFWKPNRLY